MRNMFYPVPFTLCRILYYLFISSVINSICNIREHSAAINWVLQLISLYD